MSAFINFLFTQDAITVSLLALVSTGVGVVTVFFVVLAFIINTFKGIKTEFMGQLSSHKIETTERIEKVENKVSSKVSYPYFEDTIDGVEEKIQTNKEIEQDHFKILSKGIDDVNGGIGLILKKLIPDAK